MLKIKEIVNTDNMNEFVNKDYLRKRAIAHINVLVERFFHDLRRDRLFPEYYDSICTAVNCYLLLELFEESFLKNFLEDVSICAIDDEYIHNNSIPQLCGSTCYTLTYTDSNAKEK